jgi:uncharacterized protein (DUF697 family)
MAQDEVVENPVKQDVAHETGMASVSSESHDLSANNIVKNHIIASITLGLVPVPLFDLAALTAVQMNLLRSLSAHYSVPFDDHSSKPLLTALLGGSLPVLGVLGLSSVAKLIPGIGSLFGSASLGVLAGAVTYAVGQVFMMHFEGGGTLENFEPKQAKTFFEREFNAGKAFVQTIKEALKTVKSSAGQAD